MVCDPSKERPPVPRTAGTRAAVYATAYDDPATKAAVEVLVQARVPAYVAPLVVVTATHRLDCWAIQAGEDGATGHLTDSNLLAIAWPEHTEGPRSFGRGERLGQALRAALLVGGYLEAACSLCASNRARILQPFGVQTCVHERLHAFGMRHKKLLRDRKNWRAKAAASREADEAEGQALARASRGSHSHSTTRERTGRPAAEPPPPSRPPSAPRRPGPSAGLVVDALVDLGVDREAPLARGREPEGAPPASGAAAASRPPGAGWEGGREPEDAVADELLRHAEVNTRERRDRRGRDLTLRRGAHYLFRLGMAAPGKRQELEGEMGRDPAPGGLLAAAAPERYALAARILAGKIRGDLRGKPRRTLEAYARSMVAEAWTKYLDELTRQAVTRAELAAEAQDAEDRRARGGGGA